MREVRPIDANALYDIAAITHGRLHVADVDIQPVLDYAPVRHGEWIWNGFDGIGWECSLCEHEESKEAKKPEANYCPNCGAKMDGGKRDD